MFRGPRLMAIFLGCLAWIISAEPTHAATPQLERILPRGVQRGTETDITLNGNRLEDSRELFIYSPGIVVTHLTAKSPTQVTAHLKIEPNARIGEYDIRVRTDTGISELRTLYVGPFPVIEVKEKKDAKGRVVNNDFEHPDPIAVNVTAAGEIGNEQVQYFSVEMKKGERLTAEVHGMRLGELFDPYVSILDSKKFELAVSDDTALARQDSIAQTVVPADGTYIIAIREASYGQGARYLLHIGAFPRPTIAYPLGGRPGEDLHVRFIGDLGGTIEQTVKLPDRETASYDVFPDQNGQVPPSPNHLRVSNMPNVLEKEPNDDIKSATPYDGDLPVAFNGIIEKPGDVDYFRFKAKRGQNLDLNVYARQLRSPLDSVLTLYNENGGQIADNDDSGGPDSYIRFNVPQDGVYVIGIHDQLRAGGPDYAYRVEVTEAHPEVTLTIPQVEQNSQARWTIPVPRGNRYATLLRCTRTNVGGDLNTVAAPALPDGVSVQVADGNGGEMPVVFEARGDAPIAGKLTDLTGELFEGDKKVAAQPRYEQKVELVYGNNNSALYETKVDSLAVAVTKEAPYKLHLEQPKVPLVLDGEMALKVTAERAPDFKGQISVRLLFTPPGLGAISQVDMPGDKNEIAYPINAQPNAPTRTWKICVVGMADVNGQIWVSSELVDLTVAEPYLHATIQMAAAEQGKPTQVLCKLEQKTHFDGKAKVKLLGLPPNATADDVEITSADQQVIIPVNTTEKTPVGSHSTLFARVTVMKDGSEIIHNLARGGVMRVDKPEAPKSNAPPAPVVAAKPPPPPPAGAPVRILTRLEKLREEQAQAAAQK